MILDGIKDSNEATRIANRILVSLAQPFKLGSHDVFSTASIGISVSNAICDQAAIYLRDADTAMYKAKSEGRARCIIFDQKMHARALNLLRLETDLRKAIDRNEFRLNYQPLVDLVSGNLIGFEALVRWQHPQKGLVYPADFIAHAEDTGLIIPIDRWVIQEACRQLKIWHELFPRPEPLSINVNLSSKHFSKLELLDFLDNLIKNVHIPPNSLKMEITESAFMDNIDHATFVLLQIKAMGIQLQIDDFGTGYSSLSYLHHFPVDALKIDRSFVSQMNSQKIKSAIVHTIVSLAHNLGMHVLAEGVENALQLESLRSLKCNFGQGYYFSTPLTCEDAELLITKNPTW